MKLGIPAALPVLLLAGTAASAQGLTAFPWRTCPVLDDGPRCVWVIDARQESPIRPRERTERRMQVDLFNAGSDPATSFAQVRDRSGVFVEATFFGLDSGHSTRIGTDRTPGVIIVRSDKPLLLWAYAWEHKRSEAPGSISRQPEAISSHGVQVIPIDCSVKDGEEAKNFSFVCGVTRPSDPPQ
jgi:hypothetical protein